MGCVWSQGESGHVAGAELWSCHLLLSLAGSHVGGQNKSIWKLLATKPGGQWQLIQRPPCHFRCSQESKMPAAKGPCQVTPSCRHNLKLSLPAFHKNSRLPSPRASTKWLGSNLFNCEKSLTIYQDSLSTVSVKMLVKMFAILTVEEMGLCRWWRWVGSLNRRPKWRHFQGQKRDIYNVCSFYQQRAGVGEKAFQEAVGLSHWHIWVLAEDKILNCKWL